MNKKATDAQAKILKFIKLQIKSSGFQPSLKEIANYFGYKSVTAVVSHLNALEKKGYIKRIGSARAIRILK